MGMTVQPVKTQFILPKQAEVKKTTTKDAAVKGGIIGAVSGTLAGVAASTAMLPEVLSKDVFSSEMVNNLRFPDNTAEEVMNATRQTLKESVDEIYDMYKMAAEQARNTAKKNMPKAAMIALAVAGVLGAGIAAGIHYLKNKPSKTQTKTK